VVFVSARGVVLVHRERAEHVARALGAWVDVMPLEPVATLPVPASLRRPAPPAPAPATQRQPLVASTGTSRRGDVLGWLGIVAGATVFIAGLAIPLDDPALVLALAVGLRGGRLILGV